MGAKQKRQRVRAFAALGVVVAALAAFVFLAAPWRAGDYDKKTFCPKDGEYPRTVILIDATDSLGDVQRKSLQESANELRKNLALHEWAGVFVLNEDNLAVPKAEIALCNPGDESTANPLYQNPREIKRKFEKNFAAPLRQTIDGLAALPKQDRSPIIEMVRSVALSSDFDSAQERRLIIVSDMLQHTDDYSHYGGAADYDAWRQTAHAKEFLDLSLSGVDVQIWYVKRADLGGVQTRGHIDFWEKFFNAAGANISGVKRL